MHDFRSVCDCKIWRGGGFKSLVRGSFCSQSMHLDKAVMDMFECLFVGILFEKLLTDFDAFFSLDYKKTTRVIWAIFF